MSYRAPKDITGSPCTNKDQRVGDTILYTAMYSSRLIAIPNSAALTPRPAPNTHRADEFIIVIRAGLYIPFSTLTNLVVHKDVLGASSTCTQKGPILHALAISQACFVGVSDEVELTDVKLP